MSAPAATGLPQYFPAIDSLRAVAVLAVVIFHLGLGAPVGGFVGVDIFFVISGFVVSLSVANVSTDRLTTFTTHFYARRLLRIAPALVVCLLITVIVSAMFIPRAWLSDANRSTALLAFFGLSNFTLARRSNDYFSPRAEFNPFTHTWSLAVEEQFYLIFPVVIYLFLGAGRKGAALTLGVASLLSLACCVWWTSTHPTFAFYLLPARFWELGCGVALFMSMRRWRPPLEVAPLGILRALFYPALAGLGASLFFAQPAAFPFPWAILPVLCTCLLIALAVGAGQSLPTWCTTAPLRWTGRISYSLYLWHWPVFVLFRWTVGLDSPAAKAIALALSLILAHLSYRHVELPFRFLNRMRERPRWQIVTASSASVVLSAILGGIVFEKERSFSLSVTKDEAVWLPEAGALPAGVLPQCKIEWQWRDIEGGGMRILKPARCTSPPQRARLFVAGDSHAEAYAAMLRMHAESSGQEVRILSRGGCSLFDLKTPFTTATPECAHFALSAIALVSREATAGDVLFLPSLRVQRFQDQWGRIENRPSPAEAATARAEALREAKALLPMLEDKGIRIVFELPKPIFRSPPFRCSDWFNAGNPICAGGFETSRAEMEVLRQQAVDAIAVVGATLKHASIWDPLPALCPAETCNAFESGQPLFFDGDHLSGYGNSRLFESFSSHMRHVNAAPASVH